MIIAAAWPSRALFSHLPSLPLGPPYASGRRRGLPRPVLGGRAGPRRKACWIGHPIARSVPGLETSDGPAMLDQARADLAPSGVLRAAINLSNFLLVTGTTPSGEPQGVSPDLARAVGDRLGVAVRLRARSRRRGSWRTRPRRTSGTSATSGRSRSGPAPSRSARPTRRSRRRTWCRPDRRSSPSRRSTTRACGSQCPRAAPTGYG